MSQYCCINVGVSKQRVIDKFVVGYGTEYQFKLSATPFGYPANPEIIVSVNGLEVRNSTQQSNGYSFEVINERLYVNLTGYLTAYLTVATLISPVVEVQTYTHESLNPSYDGYFEIPQQLEANPTQEEVFELSGSDLTQHFASIISNQPDFVGVSFGGNNNYRDSQKNRSVGSYILQNVAPALKSMLVSSSDDLDFILGERFSQDEYTKFKNKYLTVALQLINQEFNPLQYYNNTIIISAWVGQILKTINVSREFSSAFAYSYMIANGTPTYSETLTAPGDSIVSLTEYVNLSDPKNVMYLYDITDPAKENLLIDGIDYEILNTSQPIQVQLKMGVPNRRIMFFMYESPIPTYVPSTPTKLGMYGASVPRIELDLSYVDPINVIIGHDGSKMVAYGDYRDQLLLELEKRIYNGIQQRFRNEYYLPIRIESVRTGNFRKTRYSRDEFVSIYESSLNKWSAKNQADYRSNDWPIASLGSTVVPNFVPGDGNIWKLYNYRDAFKLISIDLTPAYQLFVAALGQTTINTVVDTVSRGTDTLRLLVLRNGVMQMEGAGLQFTVTGVNQITFPVPLQAGDEVVIFSYNSTNLPNYAEIVATAGQTIVNAAYPINLVFRNGVMQTEGLAYTITGVNEITFVNPLIVGDNVALISFTAASVPSYEALNSTAAQTVVNTSNPVIALSGMVFRNGVMQTEGLAYTITGSNQITFNAPLLSGDDISIYSYSGSTPTELVPAELPGNWKGVFQYYYDTYNPDTRPWEMLGFSAEPIWWRDEYGQGLIKIQQIFAGEFITGTTYTISSVGTTDFMLLGAPSNTVGQTFVATGQGVGSGVADTGIRVWASTAFGTSVLYADLESGIIRQGPTALFDPITLQALPQPMWARPGLSQIIPVNAVGEIISVMELFDIVFSGNYYAPFDTFDQDWVAGDSGPVEQAWESTSAYRYVIQELLYLMRPGPFGELMWDTAGTEVSPGKISLPAVAGPVRSAINWQYVQNDEYSASDEFFNWFRPKNENQIVHAEFVDGSPQVRFGYQTWISDRILFLGKTTGDTFGQKIRTLDVSLANKLAGFTNKDTTNTYIESVTPGTSSNSLIIPTTNFDVLLHKSPVIDTYSYSGVIIRALVNGTFAVYGYDLLNSEFVTLDRADDKRFDISVGGTPAEFSIFEPGTTYVAGDIVRYNGVYYRSLVTQTPQKFLSSGYNKLAALPVTGGVSVSYRPVSKASITKIPYGTVLRSAQEVFDLMIGWGAYLESKGWQFDDVSPETNQISDWLSSAKQFLFWLNTNWAPDASIQLSPLSNSATLIINAGYPNDVEEISNGVYSILDRNGVAIAPNNTTTDRDGQSITVAPAELAAGGIYYLQVNASEIEHVLIFDNSTSFGNVIYSPLLRARQQRLRFAGFRSNGWYGKMEAPGYLIIGNQLVPNYDSIVDAMRYYYDPNVIIDNPSLEDLGRRLIGYESKSYLDNLDISNDVQYLFYQGAIRQKGTSEAFEKLFRSTKVQSNEIIQVYEEWALKLSDFGNTIEQVSTEFKLQPEQNTGEVIVARLNYVPSEIGFLKSINIVNAENIYSNIPKLLIPAPDANPATLPPGRSLRQATAFVILNSSGNISRIDIVDPGYGYLSAPSIAINSGAESNALDKLYSVWQGEIISDETIDNIINIDIDDTAVWTVRPPDPMNSLVFPTDTNINYPIPNAGYVNFNDVDMTSFDANQTVVEWGSDGFNPEAFETIWVAKTFTEDWDVYKMVDVTMDSEFDVVDEPGGLFLRTLQPYKLGTQYSGLPDRTDFGNLVSLQVYEARAIAIIFTTATATVTPIAGSLANITVTNPGDGYDAAPGVTVTGDGTGADLTANIIDGQVVSINVISSGTGYTTATIVIDSPIATATATAALIPAPLDIITVTNAGDGYGTAPAVTVIGDGSGAVLTASIIAGQIDSIVVSSPGTGYTTATILIDPPGAPITATATAALTSDSLSPANITVTTPGGGYDAPPGVTVIGDGSGAILTANMNATGQVVSINVISPGAGYTTASILIDPPGVSATATATAALIPAPLDIITVTNAGDGYGTAPTPTVTVTGDGTGAVLTANIINGQVVSINVISPGTGYTTATILIGPPGGVNAATATATLAAGSLASITMVAPAGGAYSTAPTVTVIGDGTGAVLATCINAAGQVVSIDVISPGTGYTTATVLIDPPDVFITATATATLIPGPLANITVTNTGGPYSTAPTVTVIGDGTGAVLATCINAAGQVVSIDVISPGTGYTTATVLIDPPGGSATATATATLIPGPLADITVTNTGGVYGTPPVVTVIGDGSGAVLTANINAAGQVVSINVISSGTGYTTATVLIDPPGAPITATATAALIPSPLDIITVTNVGGGYDTPPVVTVIGDGSGAVLTADIIDGQVVSIDVISPGTGYTTATVLIDPPTVAPDGIVSINVVKSGASYSIAPDVTISGPGSGATAIATIIDGRVSEIAVTNAGSGYDSSTTVTVDDPVTVGGDTNYALAFQYNDIETTSKADGYNYYDLLTLDGNPISATDLPDYSDFTRLLTFRSLRFLTAPALTILDPIPDYIDIDDKLWIDQNGLASDPQWVVYTYTGTSLVPFRMQEPLIDTLLFESATVFGDSGVEEVRLPIYDPFKNILPGVAKQNLTYLRLQDPARYNVSPDPRLFSENITFGPAEVGKLWWDLSSTRFVYYEQPIALDGSESEIDNLVYRRDRWAQLFPGSTVDVYEWVESDVPPDQYTGTGIPRDIETYVQISTSNTFIGITEVRYYFWVLGATDKPNVQNRTLAALDVSRLLQAPKGQGYTFFAPIQQTATNNSYMFYNVQEILAFKGNNVQVQYRIGDRQDQEHAQWSMFREGDPNSFVTDQFWNKMVDSICGYTKILPLSSEYSDYIIIAKDLPWDIFGWDVAPYDEATIAGLESFGIVLPVPDPELGFAEKYGVSYRPRQGMFVNLLSARKVFVQAANRLLSQIPIRDNNPGWNSQVGTNLYWTYTNWYRAGFENAIPTIVFSTLTEAIVALTAGTIMKGTILQVTNATADARFELYHVVQISPTVPTLSLEVVAIQNSAIKLSDSVYTTINRYGLSEELRQLLNAFRSEVFVNTNIVDQNELFFSMMNYVLSEQKNPDWVFKTAYIFVKENNLPLTQSAVYSPSQIGSVIDYIADSKPYHTKIRDYTTSYSAADIASVSMDDAVQIRISTLNDLPWDEDGTHLWDEGGLDTWDSTTVIEIATIKEFGQATNSG